MTTNARDEKWSEWNRWSGGDNPLSPTNFVEIKSRNGFVEEGESKCFYWHHDDAEYDIIAYRYKIKEPESDMHPDLELIARKVPEWATPHPRYIMGDQGPLYAYIRDDEVMYCEHGSTACASNTTFSETDWLQARKDLGLIMSDAEEEMDAPEWAGSVPEGVEKYSPYFKDVSHLDRIDVYRVVSLFDCEKHGHAISHAVKKLLLTGVRTGGKDVETEVREAIDSLNRWLEMREEDS